MKVYETTQKSTEKKVLAYCRRHTMFQQGDKVVLGVSGGADSVCLLFVLLALRDFLGIHLHVVHVNHGVREDAAQDAEYVEALCRENDIPFMLEEIRLEELARQWGATCEEAGRTARYQAFDRACEMYGCNKIAVAHNSNDRAETMLFNLFRGTGLKGIAGILPVRDRIVRPLLCLERKEIECYLENRGILYKQDSTNDTDDYTRNRIRHHILPYAQENIAEASVANMNRAADIFAEEEEYLQEQTLAAREDCVICVKNSDILKDGDTVSQFEVSVERFLHRHPVIQKRLLLQLLKQLSPKQQDITAGHIEDIRTLFTQSGNRRIDLPYGIRGERSYAIVLLTRKCPGAAVAGGQAVSFCEAVLDRMTDGPDQVGRKQTIFLPDNAEIIFTVLENPLKTGEFQGISENRYTKWFDYDKILGTLNVRTRQTGDYLMIRGKDGSWHKKLKDYMVTEKIPREERDRLPLLAEGNHILWAVGYRISEYYKVTSNTKRILQVQFKP